MCAPKVYIKVHGCLYLTEKVKTLSYIRRRHSKSLRDTQGSKIWIEIKNS